MGWRQPARVTCTDTGRLSPAHGTPCRAPVEQPTRTGEPPPMPPYAIPPAHEPIRLKRKQVQLVANGDLRLTANQKCWPEQAKMEDALRTALADQGYELVRAHPYKEDERHGFIGSQKEGME